METDPLAQTFDAVLVGTGTVLSALAMALGRAERRVLHIDPSDRYGSENATLSWDELVASTAPESAEEESHEPENLLGSDSPTMREAAGRLLAAAGDLGLTCDDLKAERLQPHRSRHVFVATCEGPPEEPSTLIPAAPPLDVRARRRACVDLDPRVVLCRGRAVNALLASGVSHYLEFHAIEASYLAARGDGGAPSVVRVPCSKTEVFKSKALRLPEKRVLMRFLQGAFDAAVDDTATQNERELARGRALQRPQNKAAAVGSVPAAAVAGSVGSHANEPAADYLQRQRLSPLLQSCVLYSLALCDRGAGDADAAPTAGHVLPRVQQFMRSLGRYAATAFLYPVYGSGEVSQGFCRASAVYGGTYILRRSVDVLVRRRDTNAVVGFLDSTGQFIAARCVVVPAETLPLLASADDGVAEVPVPLADIGHLRGEGPTSTPGAGAGAAGVAGVAEAEPEAEADAEAGGEAGPNAADAPDDSTSCSSARGGAVADPAESMRAKDFASAMSLVQEAGAAQVCAPAWADEAVGRVVFISNVPLLPREEGEKGLSLLVLPPDEAPLGSGHPVHVLQLDSRTLCCSPGHYLIHASGLVAGAEGGEGERCVKIRKWAVAVTDTVWRLGSPSEDGGGIAHWACFYKRFPEPLRTAAGGAGLVGVGPGSPSLRMTCEEDLREAEELFTALLPGADFLPPREVKESEGEEVADKEIESALQDGL